MCICYVEAVYCCFIAVYCIFCYRVNDLNAAVTIFREFFKLPAPIIRFGYDHSSDSCAVSKNVNFDICRANAVLVIVIDPNFCSLENYCLGNVCIYYEISVKCRFIAIDLFFGNGIYYFDSAVTVFRKIVEAKAPIVRLSDNDRINDSTVCKEVDRDAFGTESVLVVRILPKLCTFNKCCFGCMCVCYVVAVNYCFVAVNLFFCDGVNDLVTCVVFREVFEFPAPVGCCYRYCFDHFTICEKVDRDAFGADAVLVIRVVPSFCTFDNCCFGGVCVCYVVAVDYCFVAVNLFFCDGVNYLNAAVTVFREVIEAPAPII